jgi:hypothetical protein
VAPLELELDQEDGLVYDALLEELSIRFHNRGSTFRTVALNSLTLGSHPLVYWHFDTETGQIDWLPLIELQPFEIAPGQPELLRVAIQRRAFASESYGGVVEISDNTGSRYWVPVSATKNPSTASPLQSTGPTTPHAGLWVGAIRIQGVGEVHSSDPTEVTPTRSDFQIRLLIHVDESGRARLLKEVIQIWKDGSYRSGPSGTLVEDQPGEFVLLTDDTLVSPFKGVALRDGIPVGRRLSTVGFDFDGGEDNTLELDGAFGIGRTLTGIITLNADFSTNPFRHRFHPDHDNLDARFAGFKPEAYEIVRDLEFEFTEEDPTGFSAPDYGYSVIAGHFRETITGLHHQPLHVQGNFRLRRIADTAELNPAPNID